MVESGNGLLNSGLFPQPYNMVTSWEDLHFFFNTVPELTWPISRKSWQLMLYIFFIFTPDIVQNVS